MKRILLILAMAVLPATTLRAQYTVPDEGASSVIMNFLAAPRDPSSLAMGACDALGRSAAFAPFTNPAYIPFSGHSVSVGASCGIWQPSMAASTADCSLGFSYNSGGKVGVGFCFATDPLLGKTFPSDENGTRTTGAQPSTMTAGGCFSYRPLDFLSFGISAKYANQSLVGYDLNAFVADAYMLVSYEGILASIGVSNLGMTASDAYSIPSSAVVALGYSREFGKHGIMACAGYERYFYGADRFCAGLSYSFAGTVSARAGYSHGDSSPLGDFFSAGLGAGFGHVGLDLTCLLSDGPLNGTLCFGLNFNF